MNQIKKEVLKSDRINRVYVGETSKVEGLPVAMIVSQGSSKSINSTAIGGDKNFERVYSFMVRVLDNYNQDIDRTEQEIGFMNTVGDIQLILDEWVSSVDCVYYTEVETTKFGYGQLASGQARLAEISIRVKKLHKI